MKKYIVAALTIMTLALASLTSAPPAQAQAYCGYCCDIDPYGNPRVRCALNSPGWCGGQCLCYGIAGAGFACY